MKLLILGSTGPTGLLVVRKALSKYSADDNSFVLYVRSPQKLPAEISTAPRVSVIEGQLEDEDALDKAMEDVDIVLSALGPRQFDHPSGTPLAHAYKSIIHAMKKHHVNRLLALGTASVEDPADRFNVVYYGMVKSVSISMRNAYKDIRAIAEVIRSSGLPHWTIIRVPILSNNESETVISGYIGDGKTGNHTFLNRAGFALFMVNEIENKEWDLKVPLIVTP
ncbi:hypothetical protein MKEN_01137400 [Mycena kentingensis (nom. inval.)]|nr:hypothetical protein MKEN_01137400 [Mycena kentingensis (nom. inval.)]